MSFIPGEITYADSTQLDAFSRLKVSLANTLFDSQQEYGLDTRRAWDAVANGTYAAAASNGSVSSAGNSVGPRDSNTKLTPITVSGTSGHYAVLQSQQYPRYIPAKGYVAYITGIFSPGVVANTDARTGVFDADNGILLKVTNGAASFVRRTSTSGSVVNNAVDQADWNIDKFDGTGPSGITLDLTKTQILFIQAQWLGVGRVLCGFDINGILWPAHQFLNANILAVPYTQTLNLPVRMELRNTGASTGGTIYFNCCSVQSEGGVESRGYPFTASHGITPIAVTTRKPILSIQPKTTFNSVTNRAHIELLRAQLRVTTNDCFYEIVLGGTLTGASFNSVSANSVTEFDIAATAISGGEVIDAGFALAGTGMGADLSEEDLIQKFPLVLSKVDGLAARQIPLSLVCTSFTGTSNVCGLFRWNEQYI